MPTNPFDSTMFELLSVTPSENTGIVLGAPPVVATGIVWAKPEPVIHTSASAANLQRSRISSSFRSLVQEFIQSHVNPSAFADYLKPDTPFASVFKP
jgi:hypothetical protein